ncbi:type IV secretion system protein [Dyella sp.]|uniref:virB8 family protein n=1 Tax=Dyella sp. TaxID=1869338 RepID=UPI002ED40650
MASSNTVKSNKVDAAISRSVNYEISLADLARRSERRAWWVAGSAVGLSLILAGGYFYMLPLKEKVPYLVMADAYTGTSTVARLTDDALHGQISTSEAINRSNVVHFIMARESYDVAMMNLRDWVTVLTMASPEVAGVYRALHAPNNPRAPYHVYGRDTAIRISILSTVLIGGGPGKAPDGATVRFQRTLYDKKTGQSRPLDNKIATLRFVYKPNLQMDERHRVENPLGFQVTDYVVNNDYAAPPPAATLAPTAPAVAASTAAVVSGPPPMLEQPLTPAQERPAAQGGARR